MMEIQTNLHPIVQDTTKTQSSHLTRKPLSNQEALIQKPLLNLSGNGLSYITKTTFQEILSNISAYTHSITLSTEIDRNTPNFHPQKKLTTQPNKSLIIHKIKSRKR